MATAIPGESLHTYPLSERFRPRAHVVWARHADAVVILDAERGRYHTLNEVAGRIWELLVASEPLVEVLRLLRDEYDAPADVLEADAAGLIQRLVDERLLERVGGAT